MNLEISHISQPENPFARVTGSDRIKKTPVALLFAIVVGIAALVAGKAGLIGIIGLMIVPFAIVFLYILFKNPIIGLYTILGLAFLLLGLSRYIPIDQIGLVMDAMLFLTFLAFIFKNFYTGVNWQPLKKDVTVVALIWFAYYLFEIINPEAKSINAWFAGRTVAMYMLIIIPLVLLMIDDKKKLEKFFLIWGVFSILATSKGIMQYLFGVDPWEKVWLSVPGNYSTHMLFGKLRVFSFLSDAGQFGANQAYSAVVAFIYATSLTNFRKKMFFYTVAALGFYGMIISGTRGAISVPAIGFMTYIILRKNFRILIPGIIVLAGAFVFFKYTYIGQGNAQIARMRSAFDPNNASLQVRLENQRKLKAYLATRPFGGGVGHAGGKARKFLPNAFLSNVPTDSWYVMIWAEMGIVGLTLHLAILFYIVIRSSFNIMFRIRDPRLKIQMAALTSGMMGIMAAAYGNGILGQMPTGIYIYASMALMLNTDVFDLKKEKSSTEIKVKS